MLGLLYKEGLILFSNFRMLLVVLFFIFFGAIVGNGMDLVSAYAGFIAIYLVIASISLEERSGFDRYLLTMPYNRRQLVVAKYLLMLVVVCSVVAIQLLIGIILQMNWLEVLMQSFLSVGPIMLMNLLCLPIIFKLGVEKARFVLILILVLPSMAAGMIGAMNVEISTFLTNLPIPEICLALLVTLILLFPLSIMASVACYQRR